MHATISFPCKQLWLPNHSVKTAKLNKVVGQLNFSFLFSPSPLFHYPPSRLLLSCSNPFILFLQGHPTQSTLSCLNKPIKELDLVHALLSPLPSSFFFSAWPIFSSAPQIQHGSAYLDFFNFIKLAHCHPAECKQPCDCWNQPHPIALPVETQVKRITPIGIQCLDLHCN